MSFFLFLLIVLLLLSLFLFQGRVQIRQSRGDKWGGGQMKQILYGDLTIISPTIISELKFLLNI